MTLVQEHWGLLVLGLCIVAALALIVSAALRLLQAVNRLRKRLETYRALPVLKALELAEARLAAAERRVASLPALLARSRTALLEIEAARAKIVVIKTAIVTLLRLSGLILKTN